jgi:hypothetical protein
VSTSTVTPLIPLPSVTQCFPDRPLRLIVDLRDLQDLDAINLGTLAAACHLGDDHRVAVFLDYCSQAIADRLTAAGVPGHRLRNVGAAA